MQVRQIDISADISKDSAPSEELEQRCLWLPEKSAEESPEQKSAASQEQEVELLFLEQAGYFVVQDQDTEASPELRADFVHSQTHPHRGPGTLTYRQRARSAHSPVGHRYVGSYFS